MTAKEMIVRKMYRVAEAVESGDYSAERARDEMYGYTQGIIDALNIDGDEFYQIFDLQSAFNMGYHPAYDVTVDEWKKLA